MSSSRPTNQQGEVIAVIDIGSAQVSGALFYSDSNNNFSIPDRIIFSTKEKILFVETPDFNYFLSGVTEALNKVIHSLKKKAPSDLKQIFVFLSSPFFISQIKTIKYRGEKPIRITSSFIRDLANNEAKKFLETNSGLSLETDSEKNVLLESKIMRVRLNGYETDTIEDRQAKAVDIDHYSSIASQAILDKIKNTIFLLYPKTLIEVQSFSFALYSTFRRLVYDKNDFVLIDPGSELTDILVVADGVLAGHITYPQGKNFLIRRLAEITKTLPTEASSALKLYQSGQSSPALKRKVAKALTVVKKDWVESFRQALKIATESSFLPETFFLIGDDYTDEIFAHFIETEDMSEITLSQRKFKIFFIESYALENMSKIMANARSSLINNTFLLIEMLFCDKIYNNIQTFNFLNKENNMKDINKTKRSLRDIFPEVNPNGGRGVNLPKNSDNVIQYKPRKNNQKWIKISIVFVLILSILGAGILVSSRYTKAKVMVIPKQVKLLINGSYQASETGENNLKFTTASNFEEIAHKIVTATGEETVEEKAKGTITILNEYSTNKQSLVTNTRFQAPNGNIYRINQPVTIPGATKNSAGELIPGRLDVTVYADKPGAEYNLEKANFFLPGFQGSPQYSKVTATTKTALTGGFIGKIKTISKEDKEKAIAELKTELTEKIKNKIKNQIPDGYVLFDDAIILNYSEDYSTVQSLASTLSANQTAIALKVTAVGILFNKEELGSYFANKQNVPGYNGEKVLIKDFSSLIFQLKNKENINLENNESLEFQLEGDAQLYWAFDENKLKEELIKANKDEYTSIFSQFPAIEKAKVEFNFPWVKKFPNNPSAISIEETNELDF